MDPDPKERLNLMSAYHCHQIKFGFDILTGNNRTHDQVVRDCNLHPYCEYDTSRARCIDKPEHPELNAKYQNHVLSLTNIVVLITQNVIMTLKPVNVNVIQLNLVMKNYKN
jgi:hypothetical protein